MTINENQLSILKTMNDEATGQWFLDGFKDWFDPNRHYDAFPPILNAFSSNKDIIEQLQELFAFLPTEVRKTWRKGLALAVRRCPKDDVWLFPLREVFFLADRIEAYTVIDEIRQKWIDEFKRSPTQNPLSEEARQTRALMFNLLSGWTNEPDAKELLMDKLEMGYFKHRPQIKDVPLIFVMLLKANPEMLGQLIEKTRHLFLQLIKEDAYFLPSFTVSLANHVPLVSFFRNIHQLTILPVNLSKNNRSMNDDKWLIAAMFGLDREQLILNKIEKTSSQPAFLFHNENKNSIYNKNPTVVNFCGDEAVLPEINNIPLNLLLKKIFQNSIGSETFSIVSEKNFKQETKEGTSSLLQSMLGYELIPQKLKEIV